MAHTHASVTVTSSSTDHSHGVTHPYTNCGVGVTHRHTNTTDLANLHSHPNVVLSFGEAALGSPNWWEHTHPITLVSMDAAGGSHAHAITAQTSSDRCRTCTTEGWVSHRHYPGSPSVGSAGAAHTHTLGVVYTATPTHLEHLKPMFTPSMLRLTLQTATATPFQEPRA